MSDAKRVATRRPTRRDDSMSVQGIRERIDSGFRVTLQQLCVAHQVGLSKIYQDIHECKLVVVKEGRRTFVEAAVAAAYLRGEAMPRGVKGADISDPDNIGRCGAATFKAQQGEARMARVEQLAAEIEAEIAARRAAEGRAS